jgi:hypothetical protein
MQLICKEEKQMFAPNIFMGFFFFSGNTVWNEKVVSC